MGIFSQSVGPTLCNFGYVARCVGQCNTAGELRGAAGGRGGTGVEVENAVGVVFCVLFIRRGRDAKLQRELILR